MRRFTWMMTALLIAAFAVPASRADDGQQDEETVIDTMVSKSGEMAPCLGACTVNFRKELKVPFEYLDGIGAVIHQARKLPDPVGLASAARSLEVAEQIAGKKASVTASVVMAEAVRLAKLRGQSQELQAVAMLASDKALQDELRQLAEAAADRQQEPDEGSREIFGTVQVSNHTHECIRFYVDGQYHGTVHHGQSRSFHVHSHNNPNHLEAYCTEGGELVSCTHVFGHRHHVHWCIHD